MIIKSNNAHKPYSHTITYHQSLFAVHFYTITYFFTVALFCIKNINHVYSLAL